MTLICQIKIIYIIVYYSTNKTYKLNLFNTLFPNSSYFYMIMYQWIFQKYLQTKRISTNYAVYIIIWNVSIASRMFYVPEPVVPYVTNVEFFPLMKWKALGFTISLNMSSWVARCLNTFVNPNRLMITSCGLWLL